MVEGDKMEKMSKMGISKHVTCQIRRYANKDIQMDHT